MSVFIYPFLISRKATHGALALSNGRGKWKTRVEADEVVALGSIKLLTKQEAAWDVKTRGLTGVCAGGTHYRSPALHF